MLRMLTFWHSYWIFCFVTIGSLLWDNSFSKYLVLQWATCIVPQWLIFWCFLLFEQNLDMRDIVLYHRYLDDGVVIFDSSFIEVQAAEWMEYNDLWNFIYLGYIWPERGDCCSRLFYTLVVKLYFSASIETFRYSQYDMYRYNTGMDSDSKTTFVDYNGQFPRQIINTGHSHWNNLNHNT